MPVSPSPRHRRWSCCCSLPLVLLLAGVPLRAEAQGELDPLSRIEQIYEEAHAAYVDLDTERAKSSLRTALRMADAHGLEGRVLGRVHLLLGVVVFAETRDEALVEEEFIAALSYDRGIQIDPTITTPTLEQVLQRARVKLAPLVAQPAPPSVEPPRPAAAAVSIKHRKVPRAYERVNIPIFVELEGGEGTVQRIVLRYRRPGGPYNEMDLIPQAGESASGYIPGHAVVGDWIEYYIEAIDWSGQGLARVGSSQAPERVSIVQARMPGIGEADGDGASAWGLPPGGGAAGSRRLVHLLFGAGTGAGIAKGPPLRQPEVKIETGIAPTPFHLYAELGFLPASDFLVLLASRLELVLEPEQLIFVPLLSLRGRWLLDNVEPVRAFLGVGGGWCGFIGGCGYVQHLVNLRPVEDTTDTTRAGNAHAGAEGGLIFDLSPHVALQLDLFLYALFLEKSSFQADLNAGLVFSF